MFIRGLVTQGCVSHSPKLSSNMSSGRLSIALWPILNSISDKYFSLSGTTASMFRSKFNFFNISKSQMLSGKSTSRFLQTSRTCNTVILDNPACCHYFTGEVERRERVSQCELYGQIQEGRERERERERGHHTRHAYML